jgi:hypothetical protein
MIQFLTTSLWKSIAAESKKAKIKMAAIAYVTKDLPLSLGKGDLLVVDASDGAIATGETSAVLLRTLHKRGVGLFSYAGLHAKTIVLDRAAFVSSGNLSDSSMNRLLEAGVWTDQPTIVSKAVSFIEDLSESKQSIKMDAPFLKHILSIPVTKHPYSYGGKRKHTIPSEKHQPKGWLVGVHRTVDPEDPAEAKLMREGKKKAAKDLSSARSEVAWTAVQHSDRLAKDCLKGDFVVHIWRETRNGAPTRVYRPARVLRNQLEPTCNRILYELVASAEKTALSWKDFKQLLKQIGFRYRIKKYTTRELKSSHLESLHNQWEQARGK